MRQYQSRFFTRRFSHKAAHKVLCALALSALAGCNNSSQTTTPNGATPAQDGHPTLSAGHQLVLISPHPHEIQVEFERAFKEKHPDAQLKWIDQGGTSDALRFVQAQFAGKSKTQGIGVDCFFGGGPETFLELERDGSLQSLPSDYDVPAQLNGVPLRGAKNLWVGAVLSGFGILINKKIAARDNLPLPQSWADLTNPALKNRIELADPRHSGSAHVAYEIILQTNGWEKGWKILTGMTINARRFIRSSSDLLQDVSSGEAVMAPSIDFYARAAIKRAGADKISYVSPRGQSVVTPDPIGILRGAPNPKLARQWVAFVLSPAGQKLWMLPQGAPGGPVENELNRQPILPSLYKSLPANGLLRDNPYSVKNARGYDANKASLRRRVLDDLIGAVLIDNHDQIKSSPRAGQSTLCPVGEAELAKLSARWNEAAFRKQTVTKWGEAVRAKL